MWKAGNPVFEVLSFNFHVWRYSPTVAMSLLSTPSTLYQSPSACMIARSSVYAYFLETVVVRGVDVEEKGYKKRPYGMPFLRRRNLLGLPLAVVRVKL